MEIWSLRWCLMVSKFGPAPTLRAPRDGLQFIFCSAALHSSHAVVCLFPTMFWLSGVYAVAARLKKLIGDVTVCTKKECILLPVLLIHLFHRCSCLRRRHAGIPRAVLPPGKAACLFRPGSAAERTHLLTPLPPRGGSSQKQRTKQLSPMFLSYLFLLLVLLHVVEF